MTIKLFSGIIATCKASLQIFNDEAVAKVTSFDNIDFLNSGILLRYCIFKIL